MSLKSRIQKNRRSKSSSSNTDVDLLEFFDSNKELETLHLYSSNDIYEEKNNIMKKSDFSFSSQAVYVEEIQRISELYGSMPSFSNPEATINISDEITMKIFVPPVISEGIYTVISKNKELSNSSNIIISNEINLYLKECLKQKLNIFVEGEASINKAIVLEFLSGILNNQKTLVYDKNNEIKSKKPCSVKINDFYKNIREIPFDNIFINEADTNELIKIFELIIGGFKGFVVSLSLKNDTDILASLRNMLLLASPNLFEENADFMSTSSVDVIVSIRKNDEGNIVISKISEIFENNNGHSVKDIFVFDESGSHISTGNRSKFFNKNNSSLVFSSEYFKENYIHSYSETTEEDENISENIEESENKFVLPKETNNTDEAVSDIISNEKIIDIKEEKTESENIIENTDFSTQSDINLIEEKTPSNVQETVPEIISNTKEEESNINIDNPKEDTVPEIKTPLSKKEKLKKKLKENKKKKTSKTEIPQKTEEIDVTSLIQPQKEPEKQIVEVFESENADEKQYNFENAEIPQTEEIIEETDDSSNEGALASETDDFQIEAENVPPSTTKITNILDDYEDDYSNENTAEISEDYSQYYVEEENKTAPDPELFAEIKDVDVNDTEIFEIEDENI